MYPEDLNKYRIISLDTETDGLQYKINRPFGFSIGTSEWSAYFDERRDDGCILWLKDQLEAYKGLIVFANAPFDGKMLESWGIDILRNKIDDVIIRGCCIDENLPVHSLDSLAQKYLGRGKEIDLYHEIAEHLNLGKCTKQRAMSHVSEVPPEMVDRYATVDAEITLELWHWQEKEIQRQDIHQIIEFETSRLPMFIRAQRRGIRVDAEYAEKAIDGLTPLVDEAQNRLDKESGRLGFNPNSSPEVKKLFEPKQIDGDWYTKEGILLPSTPKGNASISADVLREMDTPLSNVIVELRSLLKLRDTFLAKHVLGHMIGDRIYPNINQSRGETGGTATGRLSYSDPGMQQIPSRNKKAAAIVKPAFLPEEGHVWVDSDMDGFEVRVFAHLVNNATIIQRYMDDPDTDFHGLISELTSLVRNAEYSGQANAKQLNLSMIFNSGNGAIAHKMGMDWQWEEFTPRGQKEPVRYKKAGDEAMKIINQYHRTVVGVKDLADKAKSISRARGYIKSMISGRRLRFPDKRFCYKASGLLIQATAADLNKENWSIIEDQLDGVGHLILNTHDSYSLSLPEDSWREHYDRVKNEIEKPRLRVPLILELSGYGKNWWEALC